MSKLLCCIKSTIMLECLIRLQCAYTNKVSSTASIVKTSKNLTPFVEISS